MDAGFAEIVGLFLVVVGCCAIVGAASLISLALAVLTAGVFLVLAGTLTVYVAARVGARAEPKRPTP